MIGEGWRLPSLSSHDRFKRGNVPCFVKRDFSPKPPSSMTQWSRLKPLLQKDGFCRRGFRPEPPSSMRQGSRRKTLPYHHASRIDLALPSLGHRFTQSHGGLPTGIPISDHWKGRAYPVSAWLKSEAYSCLKRNFIAYGPPLKESSALLA
jgi:hypothetical protein